MATTTSFERKQQLSHEDGSTPKPKERRIVTWTQEEDDILREEIRLHGTENWTIIASKFKDKTTRQCRRRWYTYLNSDVKKGGWSPEEDMLLCEAQKIFGNRWTEIAKVVSGRTDNAVKNRFTTLCKKRAKREALAKENNDALINPNNKRVLINNMLQPQGMAEDIGSTLKKLRRAHIPSSVGNFNSINTLHNGSGITNQQLRPPFAVVAQNVHNVDKSLVTTTKEKECFIDGDKKTEGTLLRKDDPKVAALMQQAELLRSLAVKVNRENKDQILESAWKVIESFFGKSKDSEELKQELANVGLHLNDLKGLVEDLRSNEQSQPSRSYHEAYESPSSSEYSTGSTILSTTASEQGEQSQPEICTMHENIQATSHLGKKEAVEVSGNKTILLTTIDQEFSSPVQETPLFRSLASTIPSPQFSESERHFLLRTLGIESPANNNPLTNPLHSPPPCRKSLLQGL